jgi:O-antigen/teichoic acid export membrane protein
MRRFLTSSIKRVWTTKTGNGFWALTDQGIVSLGTFLTNVEMARSLPPAEYGIFALICGVFNFLNSLHSALIVVPMTTRGSWMETPQIQRVVTGSMALTVLLFLPQGLVVVAATWAVGRPQLAPWALVALILWQFQETVRRAFMARLRHREAALGDILSYLGQAGAVWICTTHWSLSVGKALILMAATSGIAGLAQMAQHGLARVAAAEIREQGRLFWQLGRWVLMTNFTGLFLSQAYPWSLATCYGPAASGQFQAAANILGISHPVAFGIGSLIYPVVARAKSEQGERAAAKVGVTYGIQGGMLLLPFYLALLIWPQAVLQLFYGAASPYVELTDILRLLVVCYLIGYLANLLVIILNSLERTRVAFFSQLASALTTMIVGLPLTVWGGVIGAAAGGSLTALARLMASGFFLKQTTTTSGSNIQ